MPEQLSPVVVFREASLRSELVSRSQWDEAMKVAEQLVSADAEDQPGVESTDEDSDASERTRLHALCERVADELIASEVLTSYQAQQLRMGRTKLTLGPYIVTEFLGQGGMGQVFGAVHEIMGRHCAIKVLPLNKSDDLTRQSFAREIRLQASLDCPYLVRAFDAGREGNVHFLVTEYVPGTDLRRLVKDGGKLSVQQSASIIAQAAAGLAYAHESGLIHRDVKPANILVTPDGHAKVADVGLAALAFGQDDDPRAGKIVGTADYLSPEQIRTPTEIGPQSDLYSLGCTLYYICTGKVPFPGGDSRSKCRRHLQQVPWDPRKFTADLPAQFVEIIADMMEKDIRKRIATANEVVRRLTPYASEDQDDDAWLAELGLLAEEELGAGKSTSKRIPGEADAQVAKHVISDLSTLGARSTMPWKVSSEGGSESFSSSDGEHEEPLGMPSPLPPSLQPTIGANGPDAATPVAGKSTVSGSTDKHFAPSLPPPIAAAVPMVRRRTLVVWILIALVVGGLAGFGVSLIPRG